MGELWRSQEMVLVQLYVQIEAAHDTVDELGELGLIQFKDLNPHVNAFQRNFVNEVKRADEMFRKLVFFGDEIDTFNKEAKAQGLQEIKVDEPRTDNLRKEHMDELESKFDDLEKQIQEMNTHQEALNRNYNQLIELNYVLEKDEAFFAEASGDKYQQSTEELKEVKEGEKGEKGEKGLGVKLGFISGVIARSKFHVFERILFRATKGNLYMKSAEIGPLIKDPNDGAMIQKNVFIVFFQGQRLQTKIKKICDSFSANLYPCPDSPQERRALLAQVNTRLQDLKLLLDRGWDQRCQLLNNIAVHLQNWVTKVTKEKAIYHTMNLFNYDVGRRCLIAEGWCPKNATEQVQLALRAACERSGALVPSILNVVQTKEGPPTYFKTNKFTAAFQSIVDSYGIARYREINPAVLTIITFPFEFGLMFGDLGHGFLLLLFAIWLIRCEKAWGKPGGKVPELLDMPYSGRYVILLMALFSMYQGALYNEFFALPLDFGSNWKLQVGPQFSNTTYERYDNSSTYVFGVDPVWKGAENELLYYNSLKMKMSIIIGVSQMSVGLFLKLLNAMYFGNQVDIWCEFLPQLLFLWAIFGYLSFLIFYKWNVDFRAQDDYNLANGIKVPEGPDHLGTGGAPVILNQLIFMFMFNYSPDSFNPLYNYQKIVQIILVLLAIICVPWMMIPKPLILYLRHKRKTETFRIDHHTEEDSGEEDGKRAGTGGHHEEEFETSEVVIHQVLETIEFVLGSISHTASYLRLWALSLAHSELATVFWDKIFFTTYSLAATTFPSSGASMVIGGLLVFVGFSGWFGATLGVLLFMETLSAFLHALRLHWIEFQSKFYKGDGYAFMPFAYRRLSGEEQ